MSFSAYQTAPACRSAGLCYPDCHTGYYGKGPVCWAHCHAGYKDLGLTCFKKPFHWYAKHTYGRGVGRTPHCGPGQQQYLALCYPHCRADYVQAGPVCLPDIHHIRHMQCGGQYSVACGAFCTTPEAGCDGIAAHLLMDLGKLVNAVADGRASCLETWQTRGADLMADWRCMIDFLSAVWAIKDAAGVFGHC